MYLQTKASSVRAGNKCMCRVPRLLAPQPFAHRLTVRSGETVSVLEPQMQIAESTSTNVVSSPVVNQASASVRLEDGPAIVDKVLELIKDSDAGLSMGGEEQKVVNALLAQLEELGKQQPPPLTNPFLWGNYVVAYTSNGKDQNGQAAGGRFRGTVGRNLFKTTGLFQSVLQPDLATNKVAFKLFGVLPGAVGLRGKVLPLDGRPEWVQVDFEPPVLSLGSNLHLRIGPPSDVTLATTYLDDRIRLGKGSRGSIFVFTRGGEAETAGMSDVGLQQTPLAAAVLATLGFLSIFLTGAMLWTTGHPLAKAGAVALWMVGSFLGAIVRRGGIILDRQSAPPPPPPEPAVKAAPA